MRYLWAPWRMEYILDKKQKGCVFCKKPAERRDEANLILFQGKYAYVIMNKFPYNSGHLMVVPKQHCPGLDQLGDEECQELFSLIRASSQVLKHTLHPHGFNIGMNIGKVGGAGVDKHIHFHIVPRWNGDTNFMTVLGETKVVPEYLKNTYRKLHAAFQNVMIKKKGKKGGQKK